MVDGEVQWRELKALEKLCGFLEAENGTYKDEFEDRVTEISEKLREDYGRIVD